MNPVFDYSKLLGRLREKNITQDAFAERIGLSRTALNLRLNNKADFKAKEIKRGCESLGIPKDDIPLYFFCE